MLPGDTPDPELRATLYRTDCTLLSCMHRVVNVYAPGKELRANLYRGLYFALLCASHGYDCVYTLDVELRATLYTSGKVALVDQGDRLARLRVYAPPRDV